MASWRDVPMPKRVAALPQDKRGFPIPWVSEWEAEFKFPTGAWKISDHPEYGEYISECSHVDGLGEPHLGDLCAARQISGMLKRLCDVCGVTVGRFAYFMGNKELITQGYRELPLHLACAYYAGQVCPGLVTKSDNIWVTRARSYRCDMVRCYGEEQFRTFHGLDDPAWIMERDLKREMKLGDPSVMLGIHAVPIQPQSWPLAEFLANHGKK